MKTSCEMEKYHKLFSCLFDGQHHISQQVKESLLQELISTFDATFEDNAADGRSHGTHTEQEPNTDTIQDILDEKIVDITKKRSNFPKKILPVMVKALKAERKLMEQNECVIEGQDPLQQDFDDCVLTNKLEPSTQQYKQVATKLKEVYTRAQSLHQVQQTTWDVYKDLLI